LGCEMSRLPHFLDNRLTHGGEAVSRMHRPPLTPRRIPSINFYYRLSRPQGHSAAGRVRSIEKSSDLIGNRTSGLPACSIVPQPTTLLRTPIYIIIFIIILVGVRLSPLGTAATIGPLYQPQMLDDNDYGATGGMRIGSGNRSSRRKHA
jgi:hypothetical protein